MKKRSRRKAGVRWTGGRRNDRTEEKKAALRRGTNPVAGRARRIGGAAETPQGRDGRRKRKDREAEARGQARARRSGRPDFPAPSQAGRARRGGLPPGLQRGVQRRVQRGIRARLRGRASARVREPALTLAGSRIRQGVKNGSPAERSAWAIFFICRHGRRRGTAALSGPSQRPSMSLLKAQISRMNQPIMVHPSKRVSSRMSHLRS